MKVGGGSGQVELGIRGGGGAKIRPGFIPTLYIASS